jgi:hypothetical protein
MTGVGACSGTSSDVLAPTTGILIRAETLTSGKGCGPGPTQLFKYAVLVYGFGAPDSIDPASPASYQRPVTANVFDCYSDGAFVNLPAAPNGNSSFRLEVFAFNRPAYEAARGLVDSSSLVGRAPVEGELRAFGDQIAKAAPTWTTECSATQQLNVQALASCKPLGAGTTGIGGDAAGPTTIVLETNQFKLPDGRVATCASTASDGGTDGGEDAGADAADAADASDASDAADAGDASPDAGGAPVTFRKVRVRTRFGARILADAVVACPAPYSLEVVAEPATYELDVGLLDENDGLVDPAALTSCSVASITSSSSSAICR